MSNVTELKEQIGQQISRSASPAIRVLVDTLLTNYGAAVQAILFYGSCLRTGDDRGGLVDLYIIVDSYRTVFSKSILAVLNQLLPPNVFYLEIPYANRMVRAKYAVLSMADFSCGTSKRWFHSYIWGRFAQPIGLLYARNDQIAQHIQAAQAQAVLTFVERVLPRVPSPFTARDLWRMGWEMSYRAELRTERPEKLVRLFEDAPDYYKQITQTALDILSFPVDIQKEDGAYRYTTTIPDRSRRMSHLDWMVRSWLGKMLSVLRLLKGLLTFRGGVDYILWKIERHSGVKVEVPPQLKRHPFLATCVIFWRLYRRGAYR